MSLYDDNQIEIKFGSWYDTEKGFEVQPVSWNIKGKKGKILKTLTRGHKQIYISTDKLI